MREAIRELTTTEKEPLVLHGSVVSDEIGNAFDAFIFEEAKPDPKLEIQIRNAALLKRNPNDTTVVHLGNVRIERRVRRERLHDGSHVRFYVYSYEKPHPNNPDAVVRVVADKDKIKLFEGWTHEQLKYTGEISPEFGLRLIEDMPRGHGNAFFSPPSQPNPDNGSVQTL